MKNESIVEYEQKYNLKLPKDFRNYLLTISSETIGFYPYIIKLIEPIKYFIHKSNNDISVDKETKDYYENYFIKTHVNGCNDDYYLCIKGPNYGKVIMDYHFVIIQEGTLCCSIKL